MNSTHVVSEDVDDGQSNDGSPRRLGARVYGVNDGNQQLREAAEEQAAGEKDAAATDVGDDGAVDEDGDDADSSRDARVLEGLPEAGVGEEIGSIGCRVTDQ